MPHPKVGHTYDIRSDYEKEQNAAPRVFRVIETKWGPGGVMVFAIHVERRVTAILNSRLFTAESEVH